jgi:hypothetical protein
MESNIKRTNEVIDLLVKKEAEGKSVEVIRPVGMGKTIGKAYLMSLAMNNVLSAQKPLTVLSNAPDNIKLYIEQILESEVKKRAESTMLYGGGFMENMNIYSARTNVLKAFYRDDIKISEELVICLFGDILTVKDLENIKLACKAIQEDEWKFLKMVDYFAFPPKPIKFELHAPPPLATIPDRGKPFYRGKKPNTGFKLGSYTYKSKRK